MKHNFDSLLKVHSIIPRSFSLIGLWDNVVYSVEKSYVDKLVARNHLHFNFNVLSTSLKSLETKTNFYFEFHTPSHCIIRHEI